jgi:hypothetical protein
MDLQEALTQISEIRQHVARTETFRGYQAAPVAFSGLLACLDALIQQRFIPDPAQNMAEYLTLWVGSAILSMIVTGVAIALYCKQSTSPLTRTNTIVTLGQFAPSVVAGGLVTFLLYRLVPGALWMLPGFWCIFFSLGIFASFRLLPKATFWVGVHYMASGALCLLWAKDEYAFSPWAMGVPFGMGQFLSAAILYWTLERKSNEEP